MAVRAHCPLCQQPFRMPDDLAGKRVRCPHCGGGVRPAAAVVVARPAPDVALPARPEHTLRVFSAGLAMLLGILTCSMFATVRLLWLHDAFPKRRPRDPSGWHAIGLALLPIYNLFWGPFALARLLTRLNEQRRQWHLPELRLGWVVAVFTIGMLAPLVVPLMAVVAMLFHARLGRHIDPAVMVPVVAGPLLNWFLFVPLLVSAVQNAANGLTEASAARGTHQRAAFLARTELKWRARQRITWAIYLALIAALHMTVVGLILANDRGSDRFGVAAAHFGLFDLPLILGSAALAARAALMCVRRSRLARSPGDLEAVIAAEHRTTWALQAGWCVLLGLVGIATVTVLLSQPHARRSAHTLLEEVLLPILFLVLPVWIGSLLLLGRVVQGPTAIDTAAASPLQRPAMPWWPSAAGGLLSVVLLAAMFGCYAWDRWHGAIPLAESGARTTTARPAPSPAPPAPDTRPLPR